MRKGSTMFTMTSRRRFLEHAAGTLGLLAWAGWRPAGAFARWDDSKETDPAAASAVKLIERGVAFLRPRQDAKGGWSTQREPGITALVVTALLRSGSVAPGDPCITRALAYLETFIGPKGGLSEAPHANYTTSIALVAFQEANTSGRYRRAIKAGQDFLKTMQWDEGEGKTREDAFYGGAGYGGSNSRPDLSNTAFFIETLRETGLPADDPNLQKAIVFISRCQNLKSEFNDQPWAGKINDGGFIYTAANGGQSIAGQSAGGGLRSYASMTYAGLKSMIYAGLSRDDPRVKAALTYITQHYSLDENPGLGQQGLYYYYHTFAKTMTVLGEPTLKDAKGISHDWRGELVAALSKRQLSNGGWVNPADRFMEGDPNLVTAYALLALAYTRRKVS
jgi:squalene-hopene/tetraprenyl-beta-curcumene cyclase